MTELVTLPAQPTLSIRSTIPVSRLGEALGERITALAGLLRARGLTPAGPPFVRYHTFGATGTDMEFGVPVPSPAGGGELPAGPAVATWHDGPHDTLGEAYARLSRWCAEHGREPAGPGWENYLWLDLRDPARPADPASWRTRLIQPLQP